MDCEDFKIRDHCYINENGDDNFVGLKVDSGDIKIYFPIGYELPKQDDELIMDIKNLFYILSRFTESREVLFDIDNSITQQTVIFPMQAYINVINYYLAHNCSYYTERESKYKIDKKGKTNWRKTIQTQSPMVQGESFFYLKQVVRISTPDKTRLITQINKYCVYESFKCLGWLYTNNKPEQPDIAFDKNMFLSILNSKLCVINNDNDKKLFRSMIAMIEFRDGQNICNHFCFGTYKFEIIWEKLIDKMFGIPNKEEFFPHAKWTERYKNKDIIVSALRPDTIMIHEGKYYIIDAKYYRYGIKPQDGYKVLPQSSDINKQITYGKFVKNRKVPNGTQVYNAFIMPYNKNNNLFGINSICGNVAEAVGDWIDNPAYPKIYERVQGIVFDTRYILKNYDGVHDSDKVELIKEIERPFRKS